MCSSTSAHPKLSAYAHDKLPGTDMPVRPSGAAHLVLTVELCGRVSCGRAVLPDRLGPCLAQLPMPSEPRSMHPGHSGTPPLTLPDLWHVLVQVRASRACYFAHYSRSLLFRGSAFALAIRIADSARRASGGAAISASRRFLRRSSARKNVLRLFCAARSDANPAATWSARGHIALRATAAETSRCSAASHSWQHSLACGTSALGPLRAACAAVWQMPWAAPVRSSSHLTQSSCSSSNSASLAPCSHSSSARRHASSALDMQTSWRSSARRSSSRRPEVGGLLQPRELTRRRGISPCSPELSEALAASRLPKLRSSSASSAPRRPRSSSRSETWPSARSAPASRTLRSSGRRKATGTCGLGPLLQAASPASSNSMRANSWADSSVAASCRALCKRRSLARVSVCRALKRETWEYSGRATRSLYSRSKGSEGRGRQAPMGCPAASAAASSAASAAAARSSSSALQAFSTRS
mmetsp:Transcript_19796/g.62755  ORF Transcript_19796/g.62755 Transcript_19796/m.62755 type:complete len:470 (+) Transcript_19796:264-1673(+)